MPYTLSSTGEIGDWSERQIAVVRYHEFIRELDS